LRLPEKNISQFQELKFTLPNALEQDAIWEKSLLVQAQLTTSKLAPKLASTLDQPNNQPTTVTTLIQLQMLSEENSLTPTLVLANGGKSNSTNNIGSAKSESETELIAAAPD
jgi:hypothetical protein